MRVRMDIDPDDSEITLQRSTCARDRTDRDCVISPECHDRPILHNLPLHDVTYIAEYFAQISEQISRIRMKLLAVLIGHSQWWKYFRIESRHFKHLLHSCVEYVERRRRDIAAMIRSPIKWDRQNRDRLLSR